MSAPRSVARPHRVDLPERVSGSREVQKADYTTAVRLDGAPSAPPIAWARGCLEDSPAWFRGPLVLGWRWGFRLRLGPLDAPGTVLGWYVTHDGDDLTTVSAGSALLEGQHHFLREGDSVTWVTVIRAHTATGRRLWRAAAPGHERSMPLLMRRAARALAQGPDKVS